MKRRQARGVAAIEFALILPVFMMMLLGMVDYGWYFLVELTATNAAREGARTATTYVGACPNGAATTNASAAVTAYMQKIKQDGNTATAVNCTTGPTGEPVFEVVVNVTFPQLTGFTLLLPVLPTAGGNALHAHADVTMRGTL
jgi:Flp pilus assembly protein TadG